MIKTNSSNHSNYDLGLISKNRNTIYGLSILWIAFFHSTLTFNESWQFPFKIIKDLGNCGVDIFLFTSGISLYFSIIKGNTITQFYIRRFNRIWVPTLCVSIPWFATLELRHDKDIIAFLQNVTGFSLLTTGNRTIWFVTAISCCYVLYPWVYKLYEKQNWSVAGLAEVLVGCLLVNAVLRVGFPDFWIKSEILWRRIPVFMIGAFMGKVVYAKKIIPISKWWIVVISAALTIIYLITHASVETYISFRYIYIILAIAYNMLFSAVGEYIIIRKICSLFAPITLEIYLVHEKIIFILSRILSPHIHFVGINILAFGFAICCAYLLWIIEKKGLEFLKGKIL